MIAIGPREVAKAIAFTACFSAFCHIVDRVIAGLAQCPVLGCGPWH